MSKLKLLGWLAVAGALVGALLATVIAVRFVPWYNTPGGTGQALCPCGENTRATAQAIIDGQLTGIILGALAFPIGGWVLARAFGRRDAIDAKTNPPKSPS